MENNKTMNHINEATYYDAFSKALVATAVEEATVAYNAMVNGTGSEKKYQKSLKFFDSKFFKGMGMSKDMFIEAIESGKTVCKHGFESWFNSFVSENI